MRVAVTAQRVADRVPRYWASISAVLFWIGNSAQSRLGKTYVGWPK